MYCPVCGQQQISEQTRFCAQCGLTLSGVSQVVANNGLIPFVQPENSIKMVSPRSRGLKQGLFLLLIGTFLIVPLIAIISAALNLDPSLVAIAAIISFCGGILRMIYAVFFEEAGQATVPNKLLPDAAGNIFNSLNRSSNQQNALPPQPANFAAVDSTYTPPEKAKFPNRGWREANTNELEVPPSVTENTTKLLDKD